MPKPENVPNPVQGLSKAAEAASEHGLPHVEAAQAAFAERFAEGFPPAHGEDDGQVEELALLDALPENIEEVLGEFLGNAPNAPGMEHARAHFPHAEDFPSLPAETLFGVVEV